MCMRVFMFVFIAGTPICGIEGLGCITEHSGSHLIFKNNGSTLYLILFKI